MPELLLEAHHIVKSFGIRRVLDIDRIELYDGDRIGLIGENGAGKSTLLSILSGRTQPDDGYVRRLCDIAFIRQTGDTDCELALPISSVFSAQEERQGLSGGEKTRRRIAGALSSTAHILFADEPTTDLDQEGARLLKSQLIHYAGAVVLVSHDRTLLDEVTNATWQLEDGRVTRYPGNYSAFLTERTRLRDRAQTEYDQYRAEQARLHRAIQKRTEQASAIKTAPSRMGLSEARLHRRESTQIEGKLAASRKAIETRLSHLDEKERPRDDPSIRMVMGDCSGITSRVALDARRLHIAFGDRVLVRNGEFRLPTGVRTALLGENGTGKTTLLSRIADSGYGIRISPGVRIGWFDQDHARTLINTRSALENVMRVSIHPESDSRTVLARLGIRGDDVKKPVSVLSGGEKAKIALARLLLSDANLLLLDEPTNHLDIYTMEALEELMLAYRGTILFVSHDRRFVEKTAQRLLLLENGRISTFEGSLSALTEKQNADRAAADAGLRASAIRMNMAALSARMDAPGVRSEERDRMRDEYFALAAELRSLEA